MGVHWCIVLRLWFSMRFGMILLMGFFRWVLG